MDTHKRKQAAVYQRLMSPNIIPLEIWDCIIEDHTLWECMYTLTFPERLKAAILNLHKGLVQTKSKGLIKCESRGFDAVFIGGGGASFKGLKKSLETLPIPVFFSREKTFVGESGGRHLLKKMACNGVIMDIGQTKIKISASGNRHIFPRDFSQIPIADSISKNEESYYYSLFCQYAGDSLIQTGHNIAQAIVIALPCWISKAGICGGSSYAGVEGRENVAKDICLAGGINPSICIYLNDAELAAVSASLDTRLIHAKKVLVITLGFGVGGAILHGSQV